jgi:hypothetical protein
LRGVAGVETGTSIAYREPVAADRVAAGSANVGGFVKAFQNSNGPGQTVLELYYTVDDVALLLRFGRKWVRQRLDAGDFGQGVLDIRGDIRIPASGVNAFITRHHRVYDLQIRMANTGRMRRQLASKAAPPPASAVA